jgi:hypothetical protein
MKREYPDILNCQVESNDSEGGANLKGKGGHRCHFIPDSYLYGKTVIARVKFFSI